MDICRRKSGGSREVGGGRASVVVGVVMVAWAPLLSVCGYTVVGVILVLSVSVVVGVVGKSWLCVSCAM